MNDGWMRNHAYDTGGYPSGGGITTRFSLGAGVCIEDHGASGYNLVEGNRVGFAWTPPNNDGASGISNATNGNIIRYNAAFGNGSVDTSSRRKAGVFLEQSRLQQYDLRQWRRKTLAGSLGRRSV